MNFKKIIITSLILTGIGIINVMENTGESRLQTSGTGWTETKQFGGSHNTDITTDIVSRCKLNASHTSKLGRTYNNGNTSGHGIANSNVNTAYLQSMIKINGAVKKGYIGNKESQVQLGVTGKHTVYEAHDGYIK